MDKLGYFAAFMLGALTGSAVTYYLLNREPEYEPVVNKSTDEDAAVVKEAHKNLVRVNESSSLEKAYERSKNALHKPPIMDYTRYFKSAGAWDIPESNEKKEERLDMSGDPIVIPPDEFGEEDEYSVFSLTYYTDGVVTDENDDIIDDIEGTIGENFAEHFGEYEDDSVFIKNDRRRCYYEVLRDLRSFHDEVEATIPKRIDITSEEEMDDGDEDAAR